MEINNIPIFISKMITERCLRSLIVLTIFGLFILPVSSNAQIRFNLVVGGVKTNSELKEFALIQNTILNSYKKENVELKIVDNFPNRLNIEAEAFLDQLLGGFLTMGTRINFYSTGTKLDYKDYSGQITEKCIYSRLTFGLYVSTPVGNYTERFMLYPKVGFGILKTKVSFDSYFQLYTNSKSETMDFTASSLYVEPEVALRIKIWSGIFVTGSVAFMIQQTAVPVNSDGLELEFTDQEPLEFNISGFQFRGGLGISF